MKLIGKAIIKMERNKVAGRDQIHIGMMKADVPKIEKTLVKYCKTVGKSKVIRPKWLE